MGWQSFPFLVSLLIFTAVFAAAALVHSSANGPALITQQAADAAQRHQRVAVIHDLDWAFLLAGQPDQLDRSVDRLYRLAAALRACSRRMMLDADYSASRAAPTRRGQKIARQQEHIRPMLT